MISRIYLTFSFIIVLCLNIVGCGEKRRSEPIYGVTPVTSNVKEYSFAVHPSYNPSKLVEAYQPLMDYLNRNIKDTHFSLEASRDYATFEEKYALRKPNIILPNPLQSLKAMEKGYHVICMAGDPKDFKGIIIVRRDANIKSPRDLIGKAVSYPAPTAMAACIMPQYFLYQNGINVNKDIDNRYVGSQESSIMNAYIRETAAASTWPPPWRIFQKDHPKEAAGLKVIWQTEPLINNSIMVRDDMPVAVRNRIRLLLINLHKTDEGVKILRQMETSRFIPADDRSYNVVKVYISRFEKHVRPVNIK